VVDVNVSLLYDRRERWLREVLRAASLSPTAKLVLFALYRHMRDDCKVSVARAVVASELGWRHNQRVSERISEAHEAGFLITLIPGVYGRKATWQGVLPEHLTVRATRTVANPKTRTVTGGISASNRPGFPDTLIGADPEPPTQTDRQLRRDLKHRRAVSVRADFESTRIGATA
jgi:hypothetical protein